MTTFVPISPVAARELLSGIGTDDKSAILIDFVEAGLVKAYARNIETLPVGGGRSEVRDSRVPRDLWRRVVAEGKIVDVWKAGTVRLDGDGTVGGKPAVVITGIRFDERAVRDAAYKHAANPVTALVRAQEASRKPVSTPLAEPIAPSASNALPLVSIATPAPTASKRGLGPDEIAVSVADAMEIVGVGRTTLYKLRDANKLVMIKVGGRTMVDAESIRRLMVVK